MSAITRRDLLKAAGATTVGVAAASAGPGWWPLRARPAAAGNETFTVYWHPAHAYATYESLIEKFEADHGVSVNLQLFQWPDLRTRILADFEAGEVPDVVEEPSAWTREFAISGDVLSLQDFIDADGEEMGYPEDWQPGALPSMQHDGEFYGVRFHFTCMQLLYNVGMFGDAGVEVPTTWDEFLEVATALTNDGVYGIALNQAQNYAWPWLFQNDVDFYDPESGEVLVPREAAVEALQFQADLVHDHEVAPIPTPGTDYAGPQQLFSAKRAAMIISGPWDLLPIAEGSPDIELGIAPSLTGTNQATVAGGAAMFIPAQARRPELSWDFIKRITALETELAATEESSMLMPRKSWAEHESVQANEQLAAFAQGLAYAQDIGSELTTTGRRGEVDELFKSCYQSIVMQNASAEDGIAEFAESAGGVLEA